MVRPIVVIAVLVVHAMLGWLLLQPARTLIRVDKPFVPLTVFSIAKTAAVPVTTDIPAKPLNIGEISVAPPSALVTLPAQEVPRAIAQSHGVILPPRPLEPLLDPKAFAVQAGISPGAGGTVVLRIEVRGDGTVAQVQIDVSGGSHKIDEAAIEYVRSLKWIGGRIDNQPQTLWIRWGVRLDG